MIRTPGSVANFCASAADAVEDYVVTAHHAAAGQGAAWKAGEINAFDIVDAAAGLADEVVVAADIGVVAGGAGAFEREFANQAGGDQRVEVVVDGGAGSARVGAVDGVEDIVGSGVRGMAHEEVEHGVPLRGAAEGAVAEGVVETCSRTNQILE